MCVCVFLMCLSSVLLLDCVDLQRAFWRLQNIALLLTHVDGLPAAAARDIALAAAFA